MSDRPLSAARAPVATRTTSRPPDRLVVSIEERREALLGVIRGARTRISLSLFRCNDAAVFAELAAAAARGVAVEALVTSRASGGRKLSDPDLETLLSVRCDDGLTVEIVTAKRLGDLKSHGKIMLIDDATVVVGSLALAALSLDFRREVAITVTEPAAVAEVVELFRAVRRDQRDGDGRSAAATTR